MPLMNKKSQGGALLTALFIMTLVAIVATAMSTKIQMDIYRIRLMINHDKLYYASQAVAFWAMSELSDPKKSFNKLDDESRLSTYPKELATIYPSVILSGALYDLQARYNLNNLANKKTLLGFLNFMGSAVPKIAMPEKVNLIFAINDWVSNYQPTEASTTFLSYYLKQKPPYYPSHQLMRSPTELRLLKGVNATLYLSLEPHITALPELTPVNINTASKHVLRTINETVTEKVANDLIKARGPNGFKSKEQVHALLEKLKIPTDQVTLESTYFLSIGKASRENTEFTVYTILRRIKNKNEGYSASIVAMAEQSVIKK